MLQTETVIRHLDQDKLLRTLGARRESRISAGLKHRLTHWQTRLPQLLTPRICHRTLPLTDRRDDSGRVRMPDGICFGSPKLATALVDAVEVCCFVSTIGSGLEMAVNDCMADNRHADAFILDTLGSMAAEALIDGFHRDYERRCRARGLGVSLRFSPGYCDWDITDQIHLFEAFKEEHPADVRLTETCLMTPCKSVSGVFGILPVDSGSRLDRYNPCRTCRQPNCRGRRI